MASEPKNSHRMVQPGPHGLWLDIHLSGLQSLTLFQGRIGGDLGSRAQYIYSLTCLGTPPRPLCM